MGRNRVRWEKAGSQESCELWLVWTLLQCSRFANVQAPLGWKRTCISLPGSTLCSLDCFFIYKGRGEPELTGTGGCWLHHMLLLRRSKASRDVEAESQMAGGCLSDARSTWTSSKVLQHWVASAKLPSPEPHASNFQIFFYSADDGDECEDYIWGREGGTI